MAPHERAAHELSTGSVDRETFARVYAENGGSNEATQAAYIRERAKVFAAPPRKKRGWLISAIVALLLVVTGPPIAMTVRRMLGDDSFERVEAAARKAMASTEQPFAPGATSAFTDFEKTKDQSMIRAEKLWPSAFVPGQPLHDEVLKRKEKLEAEGSTVFTDPLWPERLVMTVAEELKIPAKQP